MAEANFIASIAPMVIPWLKLFMYVFVIAIITVIGIVIIIEKKKRKWHLDIYEQKSDGRLHLVGTDILQEKKLKMGTKTIYFLKKAKTETIPPPWETVVRTKKKEKVAYLRIARDYVPMEKVTPVNYNDPAVKKKLFAVHDYFKNKIRSFKTTLFESDAISDRFIFVPINHTLTANVQFKPIDYDMNMMAMNEIHNADEFYQSKYEFWKKYGAVIVFGVTIVFLIVLTVLTYEYLQTTITTIMGKVTETSGLLNNLIDKMAGGKPPG
jgi:hypothetical protein